MLVDMWWCVLLLAVGWQARALASLACPRHCDCAEADDWEYECKGDNNTQLMMKALVNYNVYVQCESGDDAPCSVLPRADVAQGGRLPKMTTKRCSPAVLPCLLDAAHASDLDTLTLFNPTEELLPEHIAGMNLKELFIFEAHSVSAIPAAAVSAVPELRQLRISDADALVLAGDALAGAGPELRFLELSADGITRLPRAAFRGLRNLTQLHLWKNRIDTIHQASFEGLESLEVLDLKGNALTSLPEGVFAAAPALRVLYLEFNSFHRLGPGVFDGRHLENLTITDNKANLTVENLTFANSASLKHIILQYCHISSVPGDLFRGSAGLVTLDLSYNRLAQLPDTLFQGLTALKQLDLSYNKILELPPRVFLPLKGLVELNLNRNLIQVLPNYLFAGLRNFRQFTIDHNELHRISSNAFHGADSLYMVSLAYNRLSPRQGGYQDLSNSPFHHLKNARSLLLRGNQFDQVYQDWTNLLTQLTSLDLSYNNFTSLEDKELYFLSNKNVVDLRHNHITAIKLNPTGWLHAAGRADAAPQPRTVLLLDDNPIHCDCFAYPLALLLHGATPDPNITSTTPVFRLDAATCAAPADKKGWRVDLIPPGELTCNLDRTDCPSVCTSCETRPSTNSLELSCDHLPKHLPDLTKYGANHIKLKLSGLSHLWKLPESVSSLNLSGLELRELKLQQQPHLKELDLRNNLLTTVPEHVLNWNISLYLSNNSLECECEYKEYLQDLLSRKNIKDISDITCSNGRKITEVDLAGICAARDASLVAGGVFTVLIVLSIVLSILIYSYYYEILVYLTTRGYLKWLLTEEILDSDKMYDVFVSHSHLDGAFIQDELIPKLEEDFQLKVCVHYRDWVIGDMIPLQVVKSVEQSRKTLIVLSRNFLTSSWAAMEFKTAHCMALREGRARVVLVILDDEVMNDNRLDDDLRAYLSTNTYLERSDNKFWERLRKAVPPRERKFTFLSKFRRSGGAGKASGGGGGGGGGGGLDGQLNSDGQIVNAALEKVV